MATNDTGYRLTVGPDAEGRYLDVEPGEDYEPPAPPTSVETYEPPAEDEAEQDTSSSSGDGEQAPAGRADLAAAELRATIAAAQQRAAEQQPQDPPPPDTGTTPAEGGTDETKADQS